MRRTSHSFLSFLALLFFMALSVFLPTPNSGDQKHRGNTTQPPHPKRSKKHKKGDVKKKQSPPSSWDQIKNLLSCKQVNGSVVHDPSMKNPLGYSKLGSTCSSICTFKDVVHGSTRVMHRGENSPESSSLGQEAGLLSEGRHPGTGSSRRSSKGMQLRKLSGCYECHMIVDPSRYPAVRATICACSECGEVFASAESLEIHQSVRHAVSELGVDDSGRNIVEIIFKSSWLKKEGPIFKIERILKVHNSQRTVTRFEDYRDAVKARAGTSGGVAAAARKNPRCAADGNELLRFHCTTLTCALGARGSTSLCGPGPGCGVCAIIRHGFSGHKGVWTSASSGRAHDCLKASAAGGTEGERRRAMLVCRVIAGRVRRGPAESAATEEEGYDSVAGIAGMYSDLEELMVFSSRAILPCFVVIYKTVD
ncbi:hypothetical protein H6P81_018855 [Aristolochia fimbriata]|uniref:C2H2-type domain-containing protein n=1 Tax=Aristolochia fimbriata TaxID=158543 RepID=A0AAV7E3P6_ARIFI|nr:hypothetical protein H6P81_018855 [Aristolochia fimbriata]